MARALLVITPAEGHVNPTLGLVKQLIDNGEEVIYVCAEQYRAKIERTGAQFISYPFDIHSFTDDPSIKPTEYQHPYQFANFMVRGIIEPIIPEVLKVTQDGSYDYLIFDSLMGWGGTILAEKLQLPAVCSIASFAFVEPLGSGEETQEEVATDDKYAATATPIDVEQLYASTMEVAQKLANQFNLPVPTIEEITRHVGRLKMVYTSRYFQPQVEQLDDSFNFVGPSVVPRHDAPSFPIHQLQDLHKPIVFISLGSILSQNIDFYKLCFTTFRDMPIQFVLSSGKYTDMAPIADLIPDNFIVEPFVPQLEVLQRADVFITHAGMNSTSEALYYNVPLVTIPLTSDQPLVANRVQELGAGVVVDKNKLSPETLRAALLEVLNNPSYKQQAHVIGESLRQAGGYKQAAHTIMSYFAKV
ncbi:macrolide family glycosyltransferase [Paenibacillus sp. 481]|uniref:macrolide family glycosyltransferase n=1 Tax=Paenibacillus sp. 481 TaxID=2835869 RepID=UPI001E590285|nr:macrolide family glycosyltransferase [Paenibacillus sp. 481]UHA76116.1 glycosyl transferase [Paenibacillus sp. 481]